MKKISFDSQSYEDTLARGAEFARALEAGDIVCLFGDLGAGKTAFTKGIARGLGMSPREVHSPTFVLMNIYEGKVPLYHFDLYRISAEALFDIGYEEFFYGNGIAVIEWSERLGDLTPKDYWRVDLAHKGEDKRRITVSRTGAVCEKRMQRMIKSLS
jgi:tRNA threonylcarbamoyladenosine biosynthesis protein TsaE